MVKEAPVTEKLPVKGVFIHRGIGHVAYAGLVGMEPRHQAGPGGATAGKVVKLGMGLPVCGKFINVWRIYFPAKAAQVGIPHIIGKYYYYIWPFTHHRSSRRNL
jgi:hypothetical protein